MSDGTARIELHRRSGPSLWAVIDLADLDRVQQHRWRAVVGTRATYAATWIGPHATRRHVYLHRFVTDAPSGLDVDHIDHDGLNNRRANLRLATESQNLGNARNLRGGSSKYKGVTWVKAERRWRAQIRIDRRTIALGRFACEEDAAQAYDAAALAAWGEFAYLNFPDGYAASPAA